MRVSHAECVRVGSSGYRYAKHEATWGVWEHAPPPTQVCPQAISRHRIGSTSD